MSSPSAKKKRRVAETVSSEVPSHGLPGLTCGLSPELWGKVLDILSYSDLRSVLAVCRSMAFVMSKHVHWLHITRPRHLSVIAARRFPNVTRLEVYCLLTALPDGLRRHRTEIETDSIGGIIPFLMCFPKLRDVFVGGLRFDRTSNSNFSFSYCSANCNSPRDHAPQFRGLVRSFCGAFQHGALSSAMCLDGVLMTSKQIMCTPPVESTDEPCILCRRVCSTFPLPALIKTVGVREGFPYSDLCIRDEELVQIIRTRRWSKDCIENTSDYVLSSSCCSLLLLDVALPGPPGSYIPRISEAIQPNAVFFLSDQKLERLDLLIELGCNVRPFHRATDSGSSPEDWSKASLMKSLNPVANSGGYALTKSTFDRLIKIGYQLEAADFVIVDESNDPVLRDLNWHDAEREIYML